MLFHGRPAIMERGDFMSIIAHGAYYENPLYNVSHSHSCCELMYIVKGQLQVTAGDCSVQLSDNDCLLIKTFQHHTVKIDQNREYRRYIAMINPWELKKQLVRPDLFSLLTDLSQTGLLPLRNAPELRGVFETMADIFQNGGNIYAELGAALSVIAPFYEQTHPRETETAERAGMQLANRVRDYLERCYADDIKIAGIARDNFISTGYLTHVFKTETGLSPREYLSHIRCTRAYELIRHTDMKFSDIAENTGFCCANDMSRKIREAYGISPTEIRFQK